MIGYDRDEAIGKRTIDLNVWENEKDRDAVVELLSKNRSVKGMDTRFRKKNGEFMVGNISADVIMINGEECLISCIGDVTERTRAEEKVRKLLSEKELLLKEVHHRIKNNMYSISRLLAMHAGAAKEPEAVKAIRDAVSRVQSVMVLYEKLYKSVEYNEASVRDYLPALVNDIVGIFVHSGSVEVVNEVDDFILDAKKLQTLGIIINELITNTMKYAFAGRDYGTIRIGASLNNDIVSVTVQDNGIGLPESVSFEHSTGFGFMLVGFLMEQLNGTISIEREQGTTITFSFRK